MEFKVYSPEEDDYLEEGFDKYLREPEDVEKYRKVIAEALAHAEEVLGMSSDVKIVFGLTDTEALEDEFGENLEPNYYNWGFTFGSWFENTDEDYIFVRANDGSDVWKDVVRNMVVHERAHLEYYSRYGDEELSERLNGPVYNSVVFEGHAMNSAEKVSDTKGYDWQPHYRKSVDIGYEALKEELVRSRTDSSFFDPGGDQWENEEGYPVSYEVCKWIVREKDVEISGLPELSEDRTKKLVDEAVEVLYMNLDSNSSA